MKELLDILRAYRDATMPMALATVVETAGSSYRRPGARMLIFENGTAIGCLSGGCLDQDLVFHATKVIETQKSILIDYDTTSEKDVLFGTGTGCNGTIRVLIEPVQPPNGRANSDGGILGFVDQLVTKRQKGFAATIVRTQGALDWKIGERVLVIEDDRFLKPFRNGCSSELAGKIERALIEGARGLVPMQTDAGEIQVFCEVLHPPPSLVVFGAGQDAIPLVRLAKEVGFRVELFDWRPAYLVNNRFALADAVYVDRPEAILQHVSLDPDTAVVIMSHNFLADLECLKQLLSAEIPYLGLMGPKKRGQKMLAQLAEEEIVASKGELEKLHNPVGLDIGAEYPEEIALAIISEIRCTLTRRPGKSLRSKNGSVHEPARWEQNDREKLGTLQAV